MLLEMEKENGDETGTGTGNANVNLSTFNYLTVFRVVIKTLFALAMLVGPIRSPSCCCYIGVLILYEDDGSLCLTSPWLLFHCAIIVKSDTLRKEGNNGITRSSLPVFFANGRIVFLLFPLDLRTQNTFSD